MKTLSEINLEIRYWQGKSEGLESGGQGEAQKDKIIEANAVMRTLRWVLGEPEEKGAKTSSRET